MHACAHSISHQSSTCQMIGHMVVGLFFFSFSFSLISYERQLNTFVQLFFVVVVVFSYFSYQSVCFVVVVDNRCVPISLSQILKNVP